MLRDARRCPLEWRTFAPLALFVGLVAGGASGAPVSVRAPDTQALRAAQETDDTDRTAAWFEAHRNRPPSLRAFLQRMPKGGDIHSHLGGAVYAESYLDWAVEADYCVQESDDALELSRCSEYSTIARLADTLADSGLYSRLVDQMSVRNLSRSPRSGHERFFSAFRTIGPVSRVRIGAAVAEVATRAAKQRTHYLELMVSLQNFAVRKLGRRIDPGLDYASLHRRLLDPGSCRLLPGT